MGMEKRPRATDHDGDPDRHIKRHKVSDAELSSDYAAFRSSRDIHERLAFVQDAAQLREGKAPIHLL